MESWKTQLRLARRHGHLCSLRDPNSNCSTVINNHSRRGPAADKPRALPINKSMAATNATAEVEQLRAKVHRLEAEVAEVHRLRRVEAEVHRLRVEVAEVHSLRREIRYLRRRELRRLRVAADESEDVKESPNSPTILELMPHDMRCAVLECVGGDEWVRVVPMASRGLRDLCARKEMGDAVRRWAMGVFKRGMEFYYGYSGVAEDEDAGKALIRKAAEAGLRSARAWRHLWYDIEGDFKEEQEEEEEYAKAFTLLQAEVEGSASETEASGGPCVHAAFMLAERYEYGEGVDEDKARALELYHHAVEVDENQSAMYHLADVYKWGQLGQAVDNERTLSLYKRGAESGYYECRCYLGYTIYAGGDCGVEVDLKQALYWLEKANEQSGGAEVYQIERVRERMRTTSGQE